MKRLIAGNWKMNGLAAALEETDHLAGKLSSDDLAANEVVILPPFTLLPGLVARAYSAIGAGAQDCHPDASGARTGDISAEMLADAGAEYCIVGHSERRADHGEHNTLVRNKAEACHRAGLMPIICVGESYNDRAKGAAVRVVSSQLWASLPETDGPITVAYEPVWAVGTGSIPTLEDIAEMHLALREIAGPETRLLYGGSVKPGNAAEILGVDNVNGALIGGASLKADDFYGIISA